MTTRRGPSEMEIGNLSNRRAPYSGSARGLRKAWQGARSCEAVSTNPSERLSAGPIFPPRLLREVVSSSEQSAPRPEHAKRAIWAGRAARSREAASTDRGRASFYAGSPSLGLGLSGRREKPQVQRRGQDEALEGLAELLEVIMCWRE